MHRDSPGVVCREKKLCKKGLSERVLLRFCSAGSELQVVKDIRLWEIARNKWGTVRQLRRISESANVCSLRFLNIQIVTLIGTCTTQLLSLLFPPSSSSFERMWCRDWDRVEGVREWDGKWSRDEKGISIVLQVPHHRSVHHSIKVFTAISTLSSAGIALLLEGRTGSTESRSHYVLLQPFSPHLPLTHPSFESAGSTRSPNPLF